MGFKGDFDVLESMALLFLLGGWKEQRFQNKHVGSLSILCFCSDPGQQRRSEGWQE